MSNNEYKYNCEKCDFHCNAESTWEIHANTSKHKNGIRKIRSDCKEPLKCTKCDYKTKNKTTMIQHELNEHASIEERKSKFRYYCNVCDYGTFSIDLYNNHNKNKKHTKKIENNK
jgi:hypothetical protein